MSRIFDCIPTIHAEKSTEAPWAPLLKGVLCVLYRGSEARRMEETICLRRVRDSMLLHTSLQFSLKRSIPSPTSTFKILPIFSYSSKGKKAIKEVLLLSTTSPSLMEKLLAPNVKFASS